MSEPLGSAVLELTTDNRKLRDGLAAGRRSAGEFAQTAGRALLPLSIAIAAVGGGSIKLASDFESSFAGVRKTVNATEAEFAALSQGFREMSQEIPVNVNELNRIGEAAGQLGIKTENILDFTRVMADLGVATNLSSDQAATSLARLANITGMAQGDFDRLGSTIVALGNNFATTESEIVEMGLRIAGAGAQVGLTEGEILAVGTALSSVGIAAEAGGSAISKVMVNMSLAVSKGGESLDDFARVAGMSGAEFQRAFKEDAASAIESFIVGLGDLQASGGDVLKVLDDMGITEVRMRDALLRSAGASDLVSAALDLQGEAWEENTALTKEAEERYKTFESQLDIFWNTVKDVGITIGTVLLPMLTDMLKAAKPIVQWASDAAEGFADLSKPVKVAVAALGGFLVIGPPLLLLFGQLAISASALAGLFGGAGATTAVAGGAAAATTKVGLLSTALGRAGLYGAALGAGIGIGTLIRKMADLATEGETTQTSMQKFGFLAVLRTDAWAEWADAVGLYGESLEELHDSADETAKALKDRMGPAVVRVTREVDASWRAQMDAAQVAEDLARTTDDTAKSWRDAYPPLDSLNMKLWGFVSAAETAKAVNDELFGSFEDSTAVIVDFDTSLPSTVTNLAFLEDAQDDVTDGSLEAAIALNKLKNKLAEAGQASGGFFGSLTSGIPILGGFGSAIDDLIGGLTGGEGLSGFLNNLGAGIVDGFGQILSGGISSLINAGIALAMKGLKILGGKVLDFFKGLFRSTESFRSERAGSIFGAFEVPQSVLDSIGAASARFSDMGRKLPDTIASLTEFDTVLRAVGIETSDQFSFAMGKGDEAVQRLKDGLITGAEAADFFGNESLRIMQDAAIALGGTAEAEFQHMIDKAIAAGIAIPEEFRRGFEEAGKAATDATTTAADAVARTWQRAAETSSSTLADSMRRAGDSIRTTFGDMRFEIPVGFSTDRFKDLGTGFDLRHVTGMAEGGIVTAPTLAVIGEGRHPEAVIPLDGRSGLMGSDAELKGLRKDLRHFMRMMPAEIRSSLKHAWETS